MINKGLLEELKIRFELDQKLINSQKIHKFEKNCRINTIWLKDNIYKYGWLRSEIVSEQGELFTWLIVQHSQDINFQKKCLELLKKLQLTNERNQHIAYLTDRILVNEGKKQVYGTQFSNGKPFPIKDINNLDKRRKDKSLENFKDYSKMMAIICGSKCNQSHKHNS